MDSNPPDSRVHGILQARILEWVAISFSRGNLPNSGIEPKSPALQAYSLASEAPGKPHKVHHNFYMYQETKKIVLLILLWYLLYRSGLEPNPQYLQGVPI